MEKPALNNLIELRNRKESIHALLLADNVNIQALKVISRGAGGFLSNEIRARVWPKLLGINRFKIPDYEIDIAAHKDDGQVNLDVERSLWSHEHTIGWSEAFRTRRRRALKDIIMAVLCRNPELHYYQVVVYHGLNLFRQDGQFRFLAVRVDLNLWTNL
jgi:TBC1 domain family member 20